MEMLKLWLDDWTLHILVILGTVFAIRGTIKIDINELLRYRREKLITTIHNLCTHVSTEMLDDQIMVSSTFISPSGTLQWQCQQCGKLTYDEQEGQRAVAYWGNNIDLYIERKEKIERLRKKLGI